MYFVDSQFEMDYIKKYLTEPETSEEINEKLDNEPTQKKGLFS